MHVSSGQARNTSRLLIHDSASVTRHVRNQLEIHTDGTVSYRQLKKLLYVPAVNLRVAAGLNVPHLRLIHVGETDLLLLIADSLSIVVLGFRKEDTNIRRYA